MKTKTAKPVVFLSDEIKPTTTFTFTSFLISLLLFALLPFSVVGQTTCTDNTTGQEDLRGNTAYTPFQCPANDVVILGARIQVDNVCNSCTPGSPLEGTLIITVHHGTRSAGRYLGVYGDLTETLDGSTTTCEVARCGGPLLTSKQETGGRQEVIYGKITFTCGSTLTLSDILLVWTAAQGECPVTLANNPNGKYCYNNPVITIVPPFNTVATASCGAGNTANIDLTVNGGTGPFTYLWSNAATDEDLSNVTLGTYSVTVTDGGKRNTDGSFCTSTASVTFNGPCCTPSATCKLDPIDIEGCSIPDKLTDPNDVFSGIQSCGKAITMTSTDVGDVVVCGDGDGADFTRTYSLFFDGTLFTTCVQTIKVQDTTAPVLSGEGADATIECSATLSFTAPTASDGCDTSPVITFADTGTLNSCGLGTITRTWTATDACGNTSTANQAITIVDTTDPVLTGEGADATIECPLIPSFTAPTASDTCDTSPGPVITFADTGTLDACGLGTITRTWTATDCFGNTSTADQAITIRDITAPNIICPADATVECGSSTDPTDTGLATATDTCGTASVTSSDVSSSVGCQTVITRTWTATDCALNTATCVQRIIIRDRTAPEIICDGTNPATATDDCSDPANITLYFSNGIWTAIDESGNMSTKDCSVSGKTVETKEVLKSETIEEVVKSEISVKAYPNPFNNDVSFNVNVPEASQGSLELVNMLGQNVKTVFNGKIGAGVNTFKVNLPEQQTNMLIYVLRLGNKRITGKLIQTKR